MASLKMFVLFCIVAATVSIPQGYSGGNHVGIPYNFEWKVRAPEYGNDYGHAEQSDGNTVHGKYYVLLPDGRRQTVTYTADDLLGFIADVTYDGEAKFSSEGGGYH